MSEINQGDVYWLDFGPPIGSRPAEKHPCVVVQNNAFNRSGIATTVVCLITSNLRWAKAPGNVVLAKDEAHLSKASVVNVSQIQTVNKTELTEFIGALNPGSLASVRAGLRVVL